MERGTLVLPCRGGSVTSWLIMFFFVVDKVSIRLFSETESHVTVASAKTRYSPIALLDPVLAASVLP